MKFLILCFLLMTPAASRLLQQKKGLDEEALQDLEDADVFKYLGMYSPEDSGVPYGDGWVRHSFDPAFQAPFSPAGPVCIAGTGFSAYTRAGKNPSKLVVFLGGGGACWQGSYICELFAESQSPGDANPGIADFENKDNPFKDYSVVFLPYCDGSTWTGDNYVVDPVFAAFLENLQLPPLPQPLGHRYHYGLRNLSAGMDLAKNMFPHAHRVVIAGASAGGVGAQAFAPFLARKLFGNTIKLSVFSDSGPIIVNLEAEDDVMDRQSDWKFDQFYPKSCSECSGTGQTTPILEWRLDNDASITEAFYDTDSDATNSGYLKIEDPAEYRSLIVKEHGTLNAKYPDRYKRFIVSGDTSHVAVDKQLFYEQEANGVILSDWVNAFITPIKPFWEDIVEDPIPWYHHERKTDKFFAFCHF